MDRWIQRKRNDETHARARRKCDCCWTRTGTREENLDSWQNGMEQIRHSLDKALAMTRKDE